MYILIYSFFFDSFRIMSNEKSLGTDNDSGQINQSQGIQSNSSEIVSR